jgi:hypothetical protein
VGGRGFALFEIAASSRSRDVRVRELARQQQSVEESFAWARDDAVTFADERRDETSWAETRVALPRTDSDALAWQIGSERCGSARISSARRTPFKLMKGHESFIAPPLQQSIAELPATRRASARVALASVTTTSSAAMTVRAARDTALRFIGER